MDRYAIKGLKKLFSLTRTKIRLAREAGSRETRPSPVPLVSLLGGRDVRTVSECEQHLKRLKDEAEPEDPLKVAHTVLQLCDIIESVKYGFESEDDMPRISDDELALMTGECKAKGATIRLLLMSEEASPNSLYFGEEPPPGSRTYSRVISGIAPFLRFAYTSTYLSEGLKLKNIKVSAGGRTLIAGAVAQSLHEVTR